jgi:hypothetical protein
VTLFFGIWLLILGALAIPNLVIAKRPELKGALDKLTPIQGWLGVVSAFWGAWGVIGAILGIAALTTHPIWWITWLATSCVTLALGALLGVGTAKTFLESAAAHGRMDQTIARLSPYQGTLGIAGLGLGAWCLVASILFI